MFLNDQPYNNISTIISLQVEKYESLLSQHQEGLADSEGIIEQLNEQLFILKTELANTEMKLEGFPTSEVGINTSFSGVDVVEDSIGGGGVSSSVESVDAGEVLALPSLFG